MKQFSTNIFLGTLSLLIGLPSGGLLATHPLALIPEAADHVIPVQDKFRLHYRAQLPLLTNQANLWVPLARSSAFQSVQIRRLSMPASWKLIQDTQAGNWILALNVGPQHSQTWLDIDYEVVRCEKTAYTAGEETMEAYLAPNRLVPLNERLRELAREATRGLATDREKGQALYRHTLERMSYDKSGDGWGRGDAMYACDARSGNCTDYHAYFIALCRAERIPARFAIGFTIPADQDAGPISGYHCWAEFHAEGQWIPVDISEADKVPALADYYFGHHPANRFEITSGRDLRVDPEPTGGVLNFLVYPHLEIQGTVHPLAHDFSFLRLPSAQP